jgi:hypothetical protein
MAVLVLIGFTASYQTLRDLAVSPGDFAPWLAPAVPLSFDVGIAILSLKVVLAAREAQSAVFLRLLVSGLSAGTVVANAGAATSFVGGLMHAVPPAMFVICFESVAVSARRRSLAEAGRAATSLPSFPLALWLLDPRGTWRSWRRLTLQTAAGHHPSPPRPTEAASDAGHERVARAPKPTGADSRQTAASDQTSTVHATSGRPSRATRRLLIARDALRQSPELTAGALAEILTAAGHSCSVRTAQRVKATVLTSPHP